MSSQYGGPHDIPPQHMYPPPVPGQQQQQQPPHHDHRQHQHQHQQPSHYSNMPPPPPSYQHHYPPPQQMPPGGQQHQALSGQHGFHPRLEPAPHPRHQLPHQSMHNSQMMHQQGQMQHQSHPSSGPLGEGTTLGQLTTYCLVDEAARRKYQLQVFQQPIRARMCGFGDKDRRPITPPPCVRLTILDLATGREIDISEIDPLTFVLNVDLWDADGQKEVNLVRATGHSGVSSSNTAPNASSYPYDGAHGHYSSQQAPHHPPAPNREAGYNLSPQVSYPSDFSLQSGYAPPATQYSNPGYAPAQGYYPSQQYRQDAAPPLSSYNRTGSNASSTGYSAGGEPSRSGSTASSHQGMSSRNLIGSLAVSAFRLTDNEGKLGIWFVLQDLSVRTEGQFRLRFSAVNVAKLNNAPRDGSNPQVNRGHVPMLASGFSDVFTVYSAKKFPGVCESTPLSKTFATQGVKIPIRKDGAAKGEDDYDE